jgi:hypothetical protein
LIHPIWSATTCDFPGAGVYIGLAPRIEHTLVGRILSPKRVRLFTGAHTRFGSEGARCPLDYYAVRDPSVVRVIPVDRPPLPNGFRHVKLSFKFDRTRAVEDAMRALKELSQPPTHFTGAFLMSIGLPLLREEAFYDRAVAQYPDQEFTDLYTRMRELGCDDEDPTGNGR